MSASPHRRWNGSKMGKRLWIPAKVSFVSCVTFHKGVPILGFDTAGWLAYTHVGQFGGGGHVLQTLIGEDVAPTVPTFCLCIWPKPWNTTRFRLTKNQKHNRPCAFDVVNPFPLPVPFEEIILTRNSFSLRRQNSSAFFFPGIKKDVTENGISLQMRQYIGTDLSF